MHSTFVHRIFRGASLFWAFAERVHDPVRVSWGVLGHLRYMNAEILSGLGLEPVLTTSELAEYLGVHVLAIYDLRTDGRGPSGIRVAGRSAIASPMALAIEQT